MSDVAILTAKLLGVYDVGNSGFRVAHMKQYLLMNLCLILIVTFISVKILLDVS